MRCFRVSLKYALSSRIYDFASDIVDPFKIKIASVYYFDTIDMVQIKNLGV
jgi:hypothetical protein